MCGRFTLTFTIEEVAEILNIKEEKIKGEIDWTPRYNIAPMQQVPVVVNNGDNRLKLFQWGLVPYWAKDKNIGNKMINARDETIDTKPSFKHCFQKQRCLILADGFYEWKREGKRKIPYRITLTDRSIFGFAGIWDVWKNPKGEYIHSCSIITTGPNELMSPLHDRMPVILDKENEEIWLDPSVNNIDNLKSLLIPYRAESMQAYEVPTNVNTAKYDSIECIQPVKKQVSLFSQ